MYKSTPEEQGTQTREILLRGRKKTQENGDEQKVCGNPEIQNSEERSNNDKLQEPVGNTFLKYGVSEFSQVLLATVFLDLYGVVDRKRIQRIYKPSSIEMELMVKNASNIHNGVSARS